MSDSAPSFSHRWQPFEDLPASWREWISPELEALAVFWADFKARHRGTDTVAKLLARNNRRWAIETGVIEGVYSITKGATETLIERGINPGYIPHGEATPSGEQAIAMIGDHLSALEAIFDFVANRQELTAHYIRSLWDSLLRSQPTIDVVQEFPDGSRSFGKVPRVRGAYKTAPNNPRLPNGSIHEYCPPIHVEAEIERLLELHREHVAAGVPADIEAAWFHHRFAQIHPFPDGNGRTARALATIILLRGHLFPMVVTREERADYIDALGVADAGDLGSFVRLLQQQQLATRDAVLRGHLQT